MVRQASMAANRAVTVPIDIVRAWALVGKRWDLHFILEDKSRVLVVPDGELGAYFRDRDRKK